MYWYFTGKRIVLRARRMRRTWYGPFTLRSDAVWWAKYNGYKGIK